MAEHKMKGFTELLGLELDEEFKLSGIVDKYKLTIDGIMRYSPYGKEWLYDSLPGQVLTGKFGIIKLPKQILDDAEKEYLGTIIKPFRDRVIWIKKIDSPTQNYEYIKICYQDHNYTIVLNFPDFKVGAMYKGMETDKEYTLKELGL